MRLTEARLARGGGAGAPAVATRPGDRREGAVEIEGALLRNAAEMLLAFAEILLISSHRKYRTM